MGAAGERKGARSFVGRVGGSCGITKRGKIVRREGRRELRKNENGRNRSSGGAPGPAEERKRAKSFVRAISGGG